MDKKPMYHRCPRCELNYIKSDEELCQVCKDEIESRKDKEIIDLEMEICPVCKSNYMSAGDIMCASCLAEKGEDMDDIEDWDEYVNDDEDDLSNEDENIGTMASIKDNGDMPNGIDLGIDLDEEVGFEDLDAVAKDEFGSEFNDEFEDEEESDDDEFEDDFDDDLDDDFDDDLDDDDEDDDEEDDEDDDEE